MSQRAAASSPSPRGGEDRDPLPPRYEPPIPSEAVAGIAGRLRGIAGRLRDRADDEHPE